MKKCATLPLVSVVIPCYNSAHFITDAIESVLAQAYHEIEVIIVDDGSTDNTRDIISQYGEKVTYIYQVNSGPSAARNTGIRHANGELIGFLDSDDTWWPEKTALQVERFRLDRNLSLLFTSHRYIDLGSNTLLFLADHRHLNKNKLFQTIMTGCPFILSTVMVKKRVLCDVGMFSENLMYAEDWDLYYRISKKYEIDILKAHLVDYRVHFNSMIAQSSNKKDKKRLDDELEVVKKIYAVSGWSLSRLLMKMKSLNGVYISHGDQCLTVNQKIMALSYYFKAFVIYPFSTKAYVSIVKSIVMHWPGLYSMIKCLLKKGLSK